MKAYYKSYAFEIFPGVYPPGDDSYMLAECVEKFLHKQKVRSVLDLGTGSGIQGIVASKFADKVAACDIDINATECARHNAALNRVDDVEIFQSDLFSEARGKFDLIIFNPPYLPVGKSEPRDALSRAWDGGATGMEVTERFLKQVGDFLNPHGTVIFVQSSLSGVQKTQKILEQLGFDHEISAQKKFFFEALYVIAAKKRDKYKNKPMKFLDDAP